MVRFRESLWLDQNIALHQETARSALRACFTLSLETAGLTVTPALPAALGWWFFKYSLMCLTKMLFTIISLLFPPTSLKLRRSVARRNNRNDGVAACRWTPCLNYPELLPLRDALKENITRGALVLFHLWSRWRTERVRAFQMLSIACT